MGFRHHWRNSIGFVEATKVYPSRDRLLHQMGRSYPSGKGGPRGGDQIHSETYRVQVWYPKNHYDISRVDVYGIKDAGICRRDRFQIGYLYTLLCTSKWPSRSIQQSNNKYD